MPARILRALRDVGVTHLSAAPTVLTGLGTGPWADEGPAEHPVQVQTGGAPPSPALLARMAELGLQVTHLYGLTETYGPAAICDWRPEWDDLDPAEQARLRARQGVANLVSLPLRVLGENGADVPADGVAVGVHHRDVAGAEPASGVGGRRRLLVAVVAEHDVVAAQHHLPDGDPVGRDVGAVLAQHAQRQADQVGDALPGP